MKMIHGLMSAECEPKISLKKPKLQPFNHIQDQSART